MSERKKERWERIPLDEIKKSGLYDELRKRMKGGRVWPFRRGDDVVWKDI